jgi:uncharacterized protein
VSEPGRGRDAGGLLRTLRAWHGYLSAFAFLILIFFAATGILLNHPTWSQAKPPILTQAYITLTPAQIARLKTSADYGHELETIAADRLKLEGVLINAQRDGDDLLIRLQGIRGGSLVTADLATGKTRIDVDRQYALAIIDELHRTERAGPIWQAFVDFTGVLLIAVAVLGYGLFLTLRFRLKTALTLTALSLILMVGMVLTVVH